MKDQLYGKCKNHIRQFMQSHYSDERLAWLLAHARSGKLVYHSCCCFVGIVNADHALLARGGGIVGDHLLRARYLPGAVEAEAAYYKLFLIGLRRKWNETGKVMLMDERCYDTLRRRILIPMVKAEMRRRSRTREAVPTDAPATELMAI